MMPLWFDLSVILLGFFSATLLFWRFVFLPKEAAQHASRFSVIIPARNEEKTLALLLSDLAQQTVSPYEIIVVNDESGDMTEHIARSFCVRVLSVESKPCGWVGKCWACQLGANAATGEALLFLDADVRLAPDGLGRIARSYERFGALSVQPYHTAVKWYEQFALLFNLVQIAANGSALPRPVNLGLFGPVIALNRDDYFAAGGHDGVQSAVLEDMALAKNLRRANIPFRVFLGDAGVSFRMYPTGLDQLFYGFTKNFSTGAANTPPWLFIMVVLFVASMTAVSLNLAQSLATGAVIALLYGVCYALWVATLFFISRRIGRFHPLAVLLFPLPLAMFLVVFVYSSLIRLFRGKVKWKGRAIELER
jgi:4,4'-diaponeurosporenoate glycosyltransferase